MAKLPEQSIANPKPTPEIPTVHREEDLTPFSLPWCQALMTAPSYEPISSPDRRPLAPFRDYCSNSMFASTLWTPDTLSSAHCFHLALPSNKYYPYEQYWLLAIRTGLDGMTGRAHGGLVSFILDHNMGSCASLAFSANSTAKLEVEFLKPVGTPGVVLCRTWVEMVEGRKVWMKGSISNGEGLVFAEGKGLFIRDKGLKEMSVDRQSKL